MEDQKHDGDKVDDVMMPGFRFHPTDEELVGFYLKRKIQQRPLAIELIRQVDIYKYDPWDLPKLAANGEKEWYFYCPRDRKYRNSARPNRVTGSGFWKATGTDRPIYTSDGTKCIGLKKSLVFYRGRAAKGIKTDWMMHEFRLPSSSDSSPPPKKLLDKALPPNDAWAICRIFKKTNSIAQRALAHAWLAPFSEVPNDIFSQGPPYAPFSSETVSCTTETGSSMQLSDNNDFQPNSNATFSPIDIPSSKPLSEGMCYKPSFLDTPNSNQYPCNFMFSQPELSGPIYNLLQNFPGDVHKASENINFEPSQFNNFSMSSSPEVQDHGITIDVNEEAELRKHQSVSDGGNDNDQWLNVKMMGFPFNLPSAIGDSWNSSNSPSEFSANYSTSKCYT